MTEADAVLARSRRGNRSLAAHTAHTAVLEDLLADQVRADQMLEQSTAVLAEATRDKSHFGEELATRHLTREVC